MSADLAAFLLARCDEDQAEADWIHRDECATHQAPDIGGFPCDCHYPARVLAECEAKRRLTERHSGRHVCEDSLVGMRWNDAGEFVEDPCDELRLLALSYADHPDYDPAWRP